MQVSNVESSSVINIGAKHQAIEAKIDDSPEFFEIFQKSLYQHRDVAFVRETIANAWDAHIEAGNTDCPIKITVTKNQYIIQDFGKGIPHELMQDVYLTMGKGTKRENGLVTGGFGLGCKSPWAVCSEFTVKSTHNGLTSVYSALKSSEETNGKPCLKPIVVNQDQGLPNGVTVTVPIRDHSSIILYAAKIIKPSAIKAVINEEAVSNMELGESEGDYALADNDSYNYFLPYHFNSYNVVTLMIRYGNLMYNIPTAILESESLKDSLAVLAGIPALKNRTVFIQAAPDMLSMPPSREGVSTTSANTTYFAKLLKTTVIKMYEEYQTGVKKAEGFWGNYYCNLLLRKKVLPDSDAGNTDNTLHGLGVNNSRDVVLKKTQTIRAAWTVNYYLQKGIITSKESGVIKRTIANLPVNRSEQDAVLQRISETLSNHGKLAKAVEPVGNLVSEDDLARNFRADPHRTVYAYNTFIRSLLALEAIHNVKRVVITRSSHVEALRHRILARLPEDERVSALVLSLKDRTKSTLTQAKQLVEDAGYSVVDLTYYSDEDEYLKPASSYVPSNVVRQNDIKGHKAIRINWLMENNPDDLDLDDLLNSATIPNEAYTTDPSYVFTDDEIAWGSISKDDPYVKFILDSVGVVVTERKKNRLLKHFDSVVDQNVNTTFRSVMFRNSSSYSKWMIANVPAMLKPLGKNILKVNRMAVHNRITCFVTCKNFKGLEDTPVSRHVVAYFETFPEALRDFTRKSVSDFNTKFLLFQKHNGRAYGYTASNLGIPELDNQIDNCLMQYVRKYEPPKVDSVDNPF